MGHPDKVADQVSDAILDYCLKAQPTSRVACETLVTTDLVVVAGEITTKADLSQPAVEKLVRDTVREIGYTDPTIGFAADTCKIHSHLHSQSGDIAMGVDEGDIALIVPGTAAGAIDDAHIRCHVNPTGCFLVGGPHGDTGLTGRKIIVDTYGGRGRHGGGAFSGKDPTKVDRSAAYMARYIAKNVVAAGLARQCEVQLSYAIGYPDPLNIWVTTAGTAREGLCDQDLAELIRDHFRLTPKGIIEALELRRPIYRETA